MAHSLRSTAEMAHTPPRFSILAALGGLASLVACGSGNEEVTTGSPSPGGASAGGASGAGAAATGGGQSGGAANGGTGNGGVGSGGLSGTGAATGSGGAPVVDPDCEGLQGRCVKVCQSGECDCHCDCGEDADCTADGAPGVCVPPGEPAPPCCGAGPQCGPGAPCGATSSGEQMICSTGPCAVCVPPCRDDAFCGDGNVCSGTGLCAPARCDADGFACSGGSVCDASSPESDSHGCLHAVCASDSDCESGACVNGRCYAVAGRCVPTGCA